MSVNLPANLPSVAKAKLPAMYEHAKGALAECQRIDECKDWADKAEALASYAKQAQDDALRAMADRIQARAIRRCGELLAAIEASAGRPKKNHDGGGRVSRNEAASSAGLSERQKHTALRVARVPETDFEAAVEGDRPETVTRLAERGKLHTSKPVFDLQGIDPKDFQTATAAFGWIEEGARFCEKVKPKQAAAGITSRERRRIPQVLKQIDTIENWLRRMRAALA